MIRSAPRSLSSWTVVTSVPPVASIGSSTKTSRPVRSAGSRFAYAVATRLVSSRTMPRKPTSAVGSSRVIPSSIPRPARRTGTTSGTGVPRWHAGGVATGVVTSTGTTRTSRVASYARSVTSSSASRRNVGDGVRSSLSAVSLWATSGWSNR